jgi:hypothetical protein
VLSDPRLTDCPIIHASPQFLRLREYSSCGCAREIASYSAAAAAAAAHLWWLTSCSLYGWWRYSVAAQVQHRCSSVQPKMQYRYMCPGAACCCFWVAGLCLLPRSTCSSVRLVVAAAAAAAGRRLSNSRFLQGPATNSEQVQPSALRQTKLCTCAAPWTARAYHAAATPAASPVGSAAAAAAGGRVGGSMDGRRTLSGTGVQLVLGTDGAGATELPGRRQHSAPGVNGGGTTS